MKLNILKIIIWPKDTKKEPRILEFQPNTINLITGTSKTGKTTIIEILDYCFGSRDCTIPKIGPIRISSSWYGVLIDTIEGKKLLARRDPEQQDSTDDYYLIEGKEIEIPKHLQKNANRSFVRGVLARLAELPQVDSDFYETGSGFKSRASFGDITAFIFQPQTIVASNNTMFYQTHDEDHARKLREIFPLILGAIDSDTLIKQHRLQEVRRMIERKQRQLESIKQSFEDFKGEVRGRYIAAIELGLAKDTISSLDDADIDIFVQRLKDILLKWDNKDQVAESEVSFIGSERLSLLRKNETRLSAELSTLKIRLTQLRELSLARRSLESNLARERDRLNSVSWLSEKLEEPHYCPLCGNTAESFHQELANLKETTREVEALWDGIHIVPPMLDAEEVEVRKAIQKIEGELRQIYFEIKQIELERDNNRVSKDQQAIFIGRLEEFFATHNSITDGGTLNEEIQKLEEEEQELLKSVDYSTIAQRKEAALFLISRFAQLYGSIMQVETGDDLIQLDTSKLTIRVIGKDGKIAWLKEIGSAANWLGYHIATLLALQELFSNNSIPYVPSFLVLDQPSQTHFPDDTDEEAEHEEFEAVKRVFMSCSQAIERLKGKFQVIVTDHAGGSVVKGVENVNIVERWRKGRKLIPWHWHPAALKICIEQGSKADAALEDIMDSNFKPAILEELQLTNFNETYRITIEKSSFVEEGIYFEVKITDANPQSFGIATDYIVKGIVQSDLELSGLNIEKKQF